jgi:integrase
MGKLTDTKIRNLKSRDRAYQVADGNGLILEVRPTQQKAWLYRYRMYGRQEKLSLGTYPEISLANARSRHFEARRAVAAGQSPARLKQEERRRLSDDLQSVRGLAKAYLEDHVSTLASSARAGDYVRKQVLPAIGNKLVSEVTPGNCIAIVERIKRRGAPAVARKVLEQLRGLFGYAVDRHLLVVNPAAQIRAAKIIGVKAARDRVLSAEEIKRYLAAAREFPTSQGNRLAFRLILLTLARKGELVKARVSDIDLDVGEWRVPKEHAKNRKEHIVYLSRQAKQLFKELHGLAGRSEWILPGRDPRKHISLATLNQAIFVAKNSATSMEWLDGIWIHDLRRTASTRLHEMGWPSDVVEKALAHTIKGVRGVYNRAEYADQRGRMLQQWADYIDAIESGAKLGSIKQAA